MSPGQGSFDGLGPERPSDRLFLALQPDAAAAARILVLAHALRDRHGVRGTPLPAAQLHVTLHFLGDHAGIPEALLDRVGRALQPADLPSFDVAFDQVASFAGGLRRQPWVLRGTDVGLAGVHGLHDALGARLAMAGVRSLGHARFVPHLTLLYGDRALAPQPVEPIAWRAGEVVLVDSLVGRRRHQVLRRWKLRD